MLEKGGPVLRQRVAPRLRRSSSLSAGFSDHRLVVAILAWKRALRIGVADAPASTVG